MIGVLVDVLDWAQGQHRGRFLLLDSDGARLFEHPVLMPPTMIFARATKMTKKVGAPRAAAWCAEVY
eukprot:gene4721-18127_t